MPRKYIRKPQSRKYGYSNENLQSALDAVKSGTSIKKAAKDNGLSYGTLWNKCRKVHDRSVGGQTVFSESQELAFVDVIDTLVRWKSPITEFELRLLVKQYLDKKGVTITRFSHNMPGTDWIKLFIKRRKLSNRLADNVKPERTKIDRETLSPFFENLSKEVENVPPENIINYDETNVKNEPKSKTVLCRRGVKRVERQISHSKQSFSLMMSGTSDGKLLPPMIVYKALHLYEGWCRGGPSGTVYECTDSGWFDQRTFEIWFEKILLPYANALTGKVVIIGDNLSCHYTYGVIDMCQKSNIVFVTLPPNCTHILQPLDVGFFAPAKKSWNIILEGWRKESRTSGSIPKEIFPLLLHRFWNMVQDHGYSKNLESGFAATGISPLNPDRVFAKLLDTKQATLDTSVLNEAVVEMLKENLTRGEAVSRKRGARIEPGKGLTVQDLNISAGPSSSNSNECTSAATGKQRKVSY